MQTEWNGTKNARRCHLIALHVDGLLSDEESAELEEIKDGFKGFNKQIEKSWKNIQETAILWILWDRNDQPQCSVPTMFRICLNAVRMQKREGGGFEYHVFDEDIGYMKSVKFDFLRQLFKNFGILSGPFITWNQFLLTADNDVRYFSVNLDGVTNKLLLTEYPVRIQESAT